MEKKHSLNAHCSACQQPKCLAIGLKQCPVSQDILKAEAKEIA